MKSFILFAVLLVLVFPVGYLAAAEERPQTVGWHKAAYDADGKLLPWTSFDEAIDREMQWYLNCPLDAHGYPQFVFTTFMDGEYKAYKPEVIPCTQDGMGILSYLKYYEYTGKTNQRVMQWAAKMGDYLCNETLTPDEGAYPKFTRSTGLNTEFPLKQSSQGDAKYGPNVIEPDKGGLAGYALARLYRAPAGNKYLDQAKHNADVLVKNMREGDALHSPWPFRVDSVTGQAWGERNGNMVYILRLFDELMAAGFGDYREPREKLWRWIKTYQLTAGESRGESLWIQFFEDMTEEDNRNSWAPLEMARYLIEQKDALDPDWKRHAENCIAFALKYFGVKRPGGATLMGEQDSDPRAWGGACSKLGGVAAMFYAAGGGDQYKELAYRNLVWNSYFIREDGVVCDMTGESKVREGGWQEDCHTDVIHNYVDALQAVPEWSNGQRGAKARPEKIGFHAAKYDAEGKLVPWTSWDDAIDREMNWYLNCPVNEKGYPLFVFATFMSGQYEVEKPEIIPATQDGMGILSYLKYWEYKGKSNPKVLAWAKKMGDYLVDESSTLDEGVYPRFTRSTGINKDFPIRQSSQGDARYGVNVIEPDKGGLAGYALLKLYDVTGDKKYLDQAVHNAEVLMRTMRPGSATQSPWPFRVDSVTGQAWGERSGHMAFNLRLFDEMIARGYKEYQPARDTLWRWIKEVQIPSPDTRAESLWIDFFEDQLRESNRTSWAPLEMARYLIEQKEALDPEWKQDAEKLIQFALKYFSIRQPGGVMTVIEQDVDMRAWGGACSKLGGVAAMFYAAGGGEQYKDIAYRNLTWMMYHIDDDGCPAEITGYYQWMDRGGWQEDCHTDVIHNFMDAIRAVPEWGTK